MTQDNQGSTQSSSPQSGQSSFVGDKNKMRIALSPADQSFSDQHYGDWIVDPSNTNEVDTVLSDLRQKLIETYNESLSRQ